MSGFDDANDFLQGGGAKAFAFDNMGDTVTGTIVAAEKRQQTDMQTGKPAFWDDGNPKMMLMLTLQTEIRDDDDDDGLRSVYLRGGNPVAVQGKGTSSQLAVKEAVKRSKGKLEQGGTLTLRFSGVGKASKAGFNPPKLYEASYKPAAYNIDMDELA